MATWLVLGLGNPGPGYAAHRHNIGRLTVADLASQAGATWKSRRGLRADTAEVVWPGVAAAGGAAPGPAPAERVVLATTKTYMNESGLAAAALLGWLKLRPDHLVVIHDEIDLDLGRMRLKFGGGDNGHNGLRSIRARLGHGDYYRVRLGVGRPPGALPVEKWVLTGFPRTDQAVLAEEIERAASATVSLVTRGLAVTQQDYNS